MIRSMTAFSRHQSQFETNTLVWELRSVNQRYLEPNFKLPDNLKGLEPKIREIIRKQLSRGKLDCQLRLHSQNDESSTTLSINEPRLSQLINTCEQLQARLNKPDTLSPLELLQWPGVLQQNETDINILQENALQLFQKALNDLITSREREGQELKAMINQRLKSIVDITADIRSKMPDIVAAQRTKIQDRLKELSLELNPERLEQEIALLAQKADVDEELDRLDTHVNEVERVLNKGGACGRRLDFLMQELNREANTLSSKAIVSESTQAAVELKVLIEQMREQIQNIE